MSSGKKRKDVATNDRELISSITTIFLLYMFILYPLYMHNKYFDITLTKYNLYKVGVIVYAFFMLLAVLVYVFDKMSLSSRKTLEKNEKWYSRFFATDIAMTLFFISGMMAFFMAEDKRAAFIGDQGRRCGFQFMILAFVMYICLAFGYQMVEEVLVIFAGVSIVTYIISILQFMGKDPFNLLQDIMANQKNIFKSTFGNINTVACFTCITLMLFATMFCFTTKIYQKIIYGAAVFFGSMGMIASNSDSGYLGLLAGFSGLLIITLANSKFTEYISTLLLFAAGFFVAGLFINQKPEIKEEIEGISVMSTQTLPLLLIIVILIIAFVLCKLDFAKLKNRYGKQKIIVAAAAVIIGIVFFIIYGKTNNLAIFNFDDNWGTYRGYVWKRLMNIYSDFPIGKMIFGNGNESIRALMVSNYNDEMLKVTGTVYDNAHNEFLQYLLTMGLFGVISYLGVIITTIAACVKYGKRNTTLYGLGMVVLTYVAQSFVNINQSITTPLMFLFIGLALGVCRYEKKMI